MSTNNYFRINYQHYVFFDSRTEMSCIGAYAEAREKAGKGGALALYYPMPFPGPWDYSTPKVRYIGFSYSNGVA